MNLDVVSANSIIRERVSKEIGDKEISISVFPNGRGLYATSNIFLSTIFIDYVFYKIDCDASVFSTKHEIGHLTNSYWEVGSWLFVKILKYGLVARVILEIYKSNAFLPSKIMYVVLGMISHLGIGQYVEKALDQRAEHWADAYAINKCTNEELRGGLRLFEASIQFERLVFGKELSSWQNTHTLQAQVD